MPKKVTIKDIAREAGVSTALVSFVMNNRLEADGRQKYRVGEATRQRVLDVARRMCYQPAEKLLKRRLKSRVAAVILPDPTDSWCASFAAELERLALQEGCTALFGYSQEDPLRFRRLTELFLGSKADALVALLPAGDGQLLEEPRRAGIPCVVPGRQEDAAASARECASRLFRLLDEREDTLNPTTI